MREGLWDRARGIGIILVVYGHVLRGLMVAGLVPESHPIIFSDFAIYTFHMPLFFLLAGMNVQYSLTKGRFLQSKLSTIVYPYFLWSLLQGGIQVMLSGTTNHGVSVDDLVSIIWRPMSQFWFLYAMFLCHVFAWMTRGDMVRIGIFALVAYPVGLYTAGSLGVLSNFLIFFPFYALGGFLQPYLKNIVVQLSSLEGVAACGIGLAVTIVVASRLGGYNAPTALCSAFLGILLLLLLSYLLPENAFGRSIELLGLASMPIYLAHVLATAGMRIFLIKLEVTSLTIHVLLGVSAGLALPLLAYYAIYRLRAERWFGMGGGAAVFGQNARKAAVLREHIS
ncbi:Fucose 4-O-acetylase [Duganella sp. CF402]|uniref:acyltransferase family protein n=1 Tax=unclassified Duganella TaxID=2636909 RepID=UPI0008BB521E|nr:MULTISPECIES: acyltransferase [unclassified Duganella]RZT04549.1 fucose 4-O-acetylase-like acetyltransferase [Duganella sp. BK701]SEM32515.1 Fucose 4-O-acetylase [Duganella sp. CF402]